MCKLYIALKVYAFNSIINDKHVTLCYMPVAKTEKLNLNEVCSNPIFAKIKSVEYWEKANVTVAVLEHNNYLIARQKLLDLKGFTYKQYDFNPHITIAYKNIANDYQHLVGLDVLLKDPYLKIND